MKLVRVERLGETLDVVADMGGVDLACAVELQTYGRIMASDYRYAGGTDDFALARYLGTASTDPTSTATATPL